MNVVIDASAIIALVLQETNLPLISVTQRTLLDADALAPSIMPFEVAGAVAMAEWTSRRSGSDTDAAWQMASEIIRSTAVHVVDDASSLLLLCRQYQLRGADACYLKLSLDRGAPLLTGDKKLASAARAADVALVYDPNE